ncbi:hypothetical protein ASPTUDRAFT_39701, partial [Aspergillus tubingensis CBS 134.48]
MASGFLLSSLFSIIIFMIQVYCEADLSTKRCYFLSKFDMHCYKFRSRCLATTQIAAFGSELSYNVQLQAVRLP